MADMATSLRMQQASRIRALTFPREHGAWGLLLVPLVTGACVGIPAGHNMLNLTLFLTAALTIFWLRTPLESFFGMGLMKIGNEEEHRAVMHTIAYLAPVLALTLGILFWNGHNLQLLMLGLIGGTAFALQATLRLFGRKMRLISQAIGSIGLTSTAAGAYYAVTGQLDARALGVWFASFLFAGDQIHYVQIRLRNSRLVTAAERFTASRNFFGGQILMLVVVATASKVELLPTWTIVAFVPVVLRGFLWVVEKQKPLDLPWIGISELIHSITFGALLTTAFLVR